MLSKTFILEVSNTELHGMLRQLCSKIYGGQVTKPLKGIVS